MTPASLLDDLKAAGVEVADVWDLVNTKQRHPEAIPPQRACTRPVELECPMESACETCSYFRTSVEFKPTLTRQREHARTHGQTERAAIFDRLLDRLAEETS